MAEKPAWLVKQEAQNEAARLAWLAKPQHLKPLPACAIPTARKYSYNAETAKAYQLDLGTGEPLLPRQLPLDELRKRLSEAHPDHGGDAAEFKKLKAELDKRRGK